jgi:hypothetical protein
MKHLDKTKYDYDTVPELSKTIANELLQALKSINI